MYVLILLQNMLLKVFVRMKYIDSFKIYYLHNTNPKVNHSERYLFKNQIMFLFSSTTLSSKVCVCAGQVTSEISNSVGPYRL